MELTAQQWQQVAVFIGTIIVTIYLTLRSRKNDKPDYAQERMANTPNGNGNGNGNTFRFVAINQEGMQDDIRELRRKSELHDTEFVSIRNTIIESQKAFRLEVYQEVGKIVTDRLRLELKRYDDDIATVSAKIKALEDRAA